MFGGWSALPEKKKNKQTKNQMLQIWKFPPKVKLSEASARSPRVVSDMILSKGWMEKSAFHKLLDAVLCSEFIISGYAHQKKACTYNVMLLKSAFVLQSVSTWQRTLQLSFRTSCRLLPSGTCSAQKSHFWGTFGLIKTKAAALQ